MIWRRFGVGAISLVIGTVAFLVWLAPTAHADVNDFVITRFDATYTLTNKDRQGEMRVVENIYVDFSDNNHGLLRAIPTYYKNHRLQLKVNKISSHTEAPTGFSTYKSNGNTVLKIGDPDRTVTGTQQYTIDYTVRNVIGFYQNHHELYWDINGDQWAQEAWRVSLKLHFPKELKLSEHNPICYTGAYGSTAQDCKVSHASGYNKVSFETTKQLKPFETMSVVVGFQPGYFTPHTWFDNVMEYRDMIVAFFGPLLVIGGTGALLWFRLGRDDRGKGVIVSHYDAPKHLTPLEVGAITDFRVDNRDITATLIDLAVRGYITIIEHHQERTLRPDKTSYGLRLEKSDTTGLHHFETKLLKAIFTPFIAGREVELTSLKYKLHQTAAELRKDVNDSLLTRGYFKRSPAFLIAFSAVGLVFIGIIATVVVLSSFDAPGSFIAGTVIGVIIACIFLAFLPSRSQKGVAAKEHIEGLRLYLKTAEADRIKMLQSPNAPYAEKSQEPKRTVELFEKLLPYAVILGVEKEWATQFKDIYTSPPDWYHGHSGAFNAAYLSSSLTGGVQAHVNTAFSSPSSSSSSGFGGGGSAGGGGGGGGGGGW